MRFRAFSRQQRRVLTWWCSAEGQSREAVICDGAVRSGKTLCMGLAFFLWATACFDGMAFGLCGKTITALRRNLLREVLPTLGALGFQWREQASQNRLTVRLGGKENTLTLQDAGYPNRLRNIYDPPCLLYVRGRLPAFDDEAAVAVVGTRDCTPYGVSCAEKLGHGLAAGGAVVVSGLARGIDSAALRGALRASGHGWS